MRFRRRFFLKTILIFMVMVLAGLFFNAEEVSAAKLFLERSGQQENVFGVGDSFGVKLRLDTRQQDVNALEGKIFFPSDVVLLKEISQAESIVSYWIENPSEKEEGVIVFSGLIPGGFNGPEGQILSFEFIAKKEGSVKLWIDEVKVLLNDGKGTELGTVLSGENLIIEGGIDPQEVEQLDPEIFRNSTAPEQFTPAISRHAEMFEGKWFISFYAKDISPGIDHYEVFESDKRVDITKENVDDFEWIKAESPYLLEDQSLRSFVYVKAVDGSGNSTIASVGPKWKELNVSDGKNHYLMWGFGLLVILISVIILLSKKIKKAT